MTTDVKVSQLPIEILHGGASSDARVSQFVMELIHQCLAQNVTVSQLAIEVICTPPTINASTFLVDWDDDADFSDEIEDITDYVYDATWTLGRDYASMLHGRSISGIATIELQNTDGRFNSYKADGPYYGTILPGRAFAIIICYGGYYYAMFRGYIDSIQPHPDMGGGHTATLRALGVFSALTDRKINVAMQTNIGTGAALGVVLDEIGWSSADRLIEAGRTTMSRWWTGGQVEALTALRDVEETEFGFLRESKDGKIIFEQRYHREAGAHTTSQVTFADDPADGLGFYDIQQADDLQEIANIVEAEVRNYSVAALAVLWTCSQTGANSPAIAAGGSISLWASYPNPASSTAGVAVDAWTTPVATTDYLANSSPSGAGTNLTSDVTVAASKFDTSMKITLTNGGASTAYITFLQARGTALIESDPVTVVAEDATSQGKYGERTYPIPAKFLPSQAEAALYAAFIKDTYKDPSPIINLSFAAHASASHRIEALTRDVGDRITVKADGSAKLGIDRDFWVENISHHMLVTGEHFVTYQLSPAVAAPVVGDYWILGTSVLGTDTIPGAYTW